MIGISRIIALQAAALVAAAMTATQAQTPTAAATPVVSLIGCVAHVVLPTPASSTVPVPAVTFKLTDLQPGTGQKAATLPAEYLVVGPTSISFAKLENQRVEVTGSVTASPTLPVSGRTSRGPALSTFTVTSLKVVSTECKGS